MKSLKLKYAVLATSLSWAALLALPSAHSAPLPKPDPALARELIDHAKQHVKTLSRPVVVYHWTHRSDVLIPIKGEVPHGDPRFDDYLARRFRTFYKPDPRNFSMVGTGLYAAIDPSSTRSYGGRNWVLYQLEFRKGARFLEAGSHGNDHFSKSLQNRVIAFGCSAFSLYSIFAMDSEPACQALRILLADSPELNTQGLRYSYMAGMLDGCARRPGVAFLIWGGRDFVPQTSGAFIKDHPASSAADPTRTARVLLQYLYEKDLSTRGAPHLSPYPELSAETASIAKPADQWIQSHIMGCGKYAEDRE